VKIKRQGQHVNSDKEIPFQRQGALENFSFRAISQGFGREGGCTKREGLYLHELDSRLRRGVFPETGDTLGGHLRRRKCGRKRREWLFGSNPRSESEKRQENCEIRSSNQKENQRLGKNTKNPSEKIR